jgi:hypothetical protein
LPFELTIPTIRSIINQAGTNSGLIYFYLNACRLVKERNPGGGVQEGEVGMKEPGTNNCKGDV